MADTPLLPAALWYAKNGLPVFQVFGIRNGKCLCGKNNCDSPGKHPYYATAPNGFKNATTDADVVTDWWNRHPDCNIGLVTGAVSNLVILDVDPRNGGDTSLSELTSTNGDLPPTSEVATGGGGTHFWFRHPGGKIKSDKNVLGDGLDVKADGGYVVAPPSMHKDGNRYVFRNHPEDVSTEELPEWLLERLREPTTPDTVTPTGRKPEHIPDSLPEGKRNETLTSLAGSMRDRGASLESIKAALITENRTRCKPPLGTAEVEQIARSVSRYEPGGYIRLEHKRNGHDRVADADVTAAFEVKWLEQLEEQDTEWICPGLLARRSITLIAAPPGSGKTTFAAELAYCVATGSEHWGERVTRGRVLWLGFDDDVGRIRSEKIELLGAVPPQSIGTPTGLEPLTKVTAPLYRKLISEQGFDLVVCDTLLDLLALSDFDKSAGVRQSMQILRDLCSDTGVAFLGVTHQSKDQTQAGVAKVANSTQLTAKVDIVVLLSDTAEPELCNFAVVKNRLGPSNWRVKLRKHEGRFVPVEDCRPKSVAEKVLAAVTRNGGIRRQDLQVFLKGQGSPRSIDRAVAKLKAAGAIVDTVTGYPPTAMYSIPTVSTMAIMATTEDTEKQGSDFATPGDEWTSIIATDIGASTSGFAIIANTDTGNRSKLDKDRQGHVQAKTEPIHDWWEDEVVL